jgi:hypothetical protein
MGKMGGQHLLSTTLAEPSAEQDAKMLDAPHATSYTASLCTFSLISKMPFCMTSRDCIFTTSTCRCVDGGHATALQGSTFQEQPLDSHAVWHKNQEPRRDIGSASRGSQTLNILNRLSATHN